MSLAGVTDFVIATSNDPSSLWRMADLRKMSGRPPPDGILHRNDVVLKADAYALWYRWFVEGLCNPLRYVEDDSKSIVHVLADVLDRVNAMFPGEPPDERKTLASMLAQRIMEDVERRRRLARIGATPAEKQALIDAAPDKPRCWVCGYAFTDLAVEQFLKRRRDERLVPLKFVDILRPRGLRYQDLRIEVEHIVPVTGGGGGSENLALSCGWCNRAKGARTSLYDADIRPPRASYNLGGHIWHELPHPFWTVRLLATRQRCESAQPCTMTTANAELFIAPSDPRGAPNPSNLHVYCRDHDPYMTSRFYAHDAAATVWSARAKAYA